MPPSSSTNTPLINTHKEIIYLNYSPRCDRCISAMRVAAFLAFDTDDYTPKDLGHSEHRDSDDESVSTDSETGYIPRVANGNWRIDVMNKYGIGLRRQRAPTNRKSRPPTQQVIVSDSGIGSSLESADSAGSDSPGYGSSTPPVSSPSSVLTPRAGSASGALATPSIPGRGVSSTSCSKIPVSRGSNRPSTSSSSSGQTSGGGPRSRPVARMGLGDILLSPLASICSPKKEGLNRRETADLEKLKGGSKVGFFKKFAQEK